MNMPMDKRLLGIFMLLSTQRNYVHDLLPEDGSAPTDDMLKKNCLAEAHVDLAGQKAFYEAFGKNGAKKKPDQVLQSMLDALPKSPTVRDATRQLFEVLSYVLSTSPVSYSPPPCPRKATLQHIIDAVNSAPVPGPQDPACKGGKPLS
jgi:hypothetical protein